MRLAPFLAAVLLTIGCAPTPPPVAAPPVRARPKPARPSAAQQLASARASFDASRYAQAEREFEAVARGELADVGRLGLAQVLLVTGRYAEAAGAASALATGPVRLTATAVQAEALRRLGQIEAAEAVLRQVEAEPNARAARLLLGELLLELGRRADAEAVLLTLVDDYNQDRLPKDDGMAVALVGRAAQLLRSPKDANDAYDEAERRLAGNTRLLLWRAELYLDNYDPGHAADVTGEVLERAPRQPEALVWMAQVKLAQTLDFDAAERLARQALAVDPKLATAYFVLSGIALRDMDLVAADAHADAGLQHNPRNLDLLSVKAAVRFLADDADGFDRARRRVFAICPTYSRMYQIIGEYAEWEHRYDEIVEMMREAVVIDPRDAKARATLGLNLIRAGNDSDGVRALQRAFQDDPFNVRGYNTLGLFEKVIPRDYVSVTHGAFTIRYHKDERALLDRYVPKLLDTAWKHMVASYGFTPQTPVGVELYAERENFSIRTSGLPNTGIQGVCFGKTLAAVSPRNETFNIGMTLWHELSHVFHIQLSRAHVPRWFTEGLAEYETLSAHPEWSREHDPDLYAALRAGRVPELSAMNRAFTHAESMSDMATAYYASSRILILLEQRYGGAKLATLLRLWGEGKRTPEVIQTGLGVSLPELDRQLREQMTRDLGRYAAQFVPLSHPPPLEDARAAAKATPRDPEVQTRLAVAALEADQPKLAREAAAAATAADPKAADALWVLVRIAVADRDPKAAGAAVGRMLAAGHDGYVVQMIRAQIALAGDDSAGAQAALEAACGFDPTMAEPLGALATLARKLGRGDQELDALRKLVRLEEHDAESWRRLLELLVERQLYAEARAAGESALYVDIEGMRTHQLFAEALAADGDRSGAVFELESAVLCPGRPEEQADAQAQLASAYLAAGRPRDARRAAKRARELDAGNARLAKLRI